MMRKLFSTTLIAVIILLLSGCNSALPTQSIQIPEQFQQIAEETAGNIINGLSKKDYGIFSKNFDPKMKAAIPSTAMIEVQKLLWGQNGEFQMMQTKSVYEEKGYFVGDFNLIFKKGEISMRVVYSPTEPYLVNGLWFPTN